MIARCLLFLAAFFASGAHAQYKVSEVVAKGGQVMTAEQIRAEIVGATIGGYTENGFQFELKLTADGKLDGMMYTPRGSSGMIGTWAISGKNQICTKVKTIVWGNEISRCVWYWKAGNEYFSTNSRTDDEASGQFVECLMSGGKECDGGFSLAKRSVRR